MDGNETDVLCIDALVASALDAEQRRIRHLSKALECVQHDELRILWRERLQLARAHAGRLTRMLGCRVDPMLEAAPARPEDCLLDAMELALHNGDLVAAEAIAKECIALADMQCVRAWRELDGALTEANANSSDFDARDCDAALPAFTPL